jgi:uncharacterized damage-inducible protein DinB
MKSKFRYKAWVNAEMLDSIAKVDPSQHPEQWTLKSLPRRWAGYGEPLA